MKKAFLTCLVVLCVGGCISLPSPPPRHYPIVTVSSLAAQGANLSPPKSYNFGPPPADEALIDDRLRGLFAVQLKAKGLTRTAKSLDWVITSSHSAMPVEVTVPGGHRNESVYIDPKIETITVMRRGSPITESRIVRGYWKNVRKELPSKSRQEWIFKIGFSIYAAASAPPDTPTALPLWEGSVTNQGRQADILKAASTMVRELAREFPISSGLPMTREALP